MSIAADIAAARGLQAEVRLWDNSRADMLGQEEVFEVEWAAKWAEGVGQSSWYASATGKKPVLLLLVVDARREERHIYRAAAACASASVRLEVYPLSEAENVQ